MNPSIREIVLKNTETHTPLVFTDELKAEFIDAYNSDYEIIDEIIANKYGSRIVKTATGYGWKTITRAFVYSKKYMLETLYKTMFLEYDPLQNYNGHEEEVIKGDNTIIDNFIKGSQTNSGNQIIGEQENKGKNVVGNSKQTIKNGSHIDNVNSSGNDSISDKVAPYENSNQFPKDWTDKNSSSNQMNTYGEQTNTIQDDGRTDNSTTTIGQRVDNFTNIDGQRSDDDTKIEDLYTKRVLDRAGNLGVTTSQQMLVSEREDAAPFDFWMIFAKELVAFCCEPYCRGVGI